jgi:pimeloyl-ACP methyl ester carboxylesterase
VVLLPGITGSVLRRRGEVVWGFGGALLGQALLTGGGKIRDSLMLRNDSATVDDLGDGIVAEKLVPDLHLLPGFWKIDGYTRVAQVLLERFELESGENFFEFPYDWRRDNAVAAKRLATAAVKWLERRRQRAPDAKLVLIAHSMGGLVSRYFLEVLGGWRHTRALITFGTPYGGSLNALDTLANGMRKGPFGLVDLTEMGRSFTSIYQLLPTFPCYDAGSGPLQKVGATSGIPNVDDAKAAAALEFHEAIKRAVAANEADPDYLRDRYRIYPIVGIRQDTNLSAKRTDDAVSLLTTLKGEDLSGDGTVPRIAATPFELGNEAGAMFAATKHGSLQNADATLEHVCGVLSGLRLDLGDFRDLTHRPAAGGPKPHGVNRIALEVEDLYWSGEPVRIRARTDDPSIALNAAVSESSTAEVVAHLELVQQSDGSRSIEFTPPRQGSYRVQVTGAAGVEPAEDSFAVSSARDN